MTFSPFGFVFPELLHRRGLLSCYLSLGPLVCLSLGPIFNAARGLDEFSLSVAREMRKVFPQKQFMRLPLDHPVFNARYRIQQVMTMVNGVQFQQPPEVYSMDIGTRAAAILVPTGLGAAWSGEQYHPAGKHIL